MTSTEDHAKHELQMFLDTLQDTISGDANKQWSEDRFLTVAEFKKGMNLVLTALGWH